MSVPPLLLAEVLLYHSYLSVPPLLVSLAETVSVVPSPNGCLCDAAGLSVDGRALKGDLGLLDGDYCAVGAEIGLAVRGDEFAFRFPAVHGGRNILERKAVAVGSGDLQSLEVVRERPWQDKYLSCRG